MVDIQSATAEIRRGIKKEEHKNCREKYNGPLLHRAAIRRHKIERNYRAKI